MNTKVNWLTLFPDEFKARLRSVPLAYLPMGLCEPHGQISAFGLDTFKAEYIVGQAASKWGGIVVPTMNYHVHEIGPSAKFLEDQVGENNPHMTGVPSYIFLHFYWYQLRALYNAGFQAAVVLSGHGGSHVADTRRVTEYFAECTGMQIWFGTDFDLAAPDFPGDHAGKYEISVLMHLHPELVDHRKKLLEDVAGSGGRLALGDTAGEASAEYGERIVIRCMDKLKDIVAEIKGKLGEPDEGQLLTFEQAEVWWRRLLLEEGNWATMRPRDSQPPVSDGSRWKHGEFGKWHM
jgi:creatinine amidohydrolase